MGIVSQRVYPPVFLSVELWKKKRKINDKLTHRHVEVVKRNYPKQNMYKW